MWTLGRRATEKILPMYPELWPEDLHVLVWDFTAVVASKSTLKTSVNSAVLFLSNFVLIL